MEEEGTEENKGGYVNRNVDHETERLKKPKERYEEQQKKEEEEEELWQQH